MKGKRKAGEKWQGRTAEACRGKRWYRKEMAGENDRQVKEGFGGEEKSGRGGRQRNRGEKQVGGGKWNDRENKGE